MFESHEYYNDLSLRLSEVLDEIGVNKRVVLMRRREILLQETITESTISGQSYYRFGSLSEGTTTVGLKSDADELICSNNFNLIKDYAEWKPFCRNIMMIQDDTTSPGYCLLQLIRDDLPLPATHVPGEDYVKVSQEKVLLTNNVFTLITSHNVVQDGPSFSTQGTPGLRDTDEVHAFPCKSWPYEAREWLHRQGLGKWPTPEMKRFAENSGCFVVPVGSKVSQNAVLEWRISTALAERCLMFSLNITQIRCYVLMKMIIKTYLNSTGEGHLSSFMCKTVLFYCIENTHSSLWVERNLLTCLSQCLHGIFTCLLQGNCPHFIIPGNNLMARQFLAEVKHTLLENLRYIMHSNGLALLGIRIDDLGQRLQLKLNMIHQTVQTIRSARDICLQISAEYLVSTAKTLNNCYKVLLCRLTDARAETTPQSLLQFLHKNYREHGILEQITSSLLIPFICSSIGTVIASSNIQTNNTVSQEALNWINLGLNSDVLSGRLKLASVLYCLGEMVSTGVVLRDTERQYNGHSVESICGCLSFHVPTVKEGFMKDCYNTETARAIRANTAFCIRFTHAEIHCVPHELQYEMFRSTQDELLHSNKYLDCWMDWAVVDSLPYLYFLQYKTYGQLQRYADQQQALNNLIATIEIEDNLNHRETALNLLGQCMEQENQVQNALNCYTRSLNIRKRNNVAKVHICKLFANILNNEM